MFLLVNNVIAIGVAWCIGFRCVGSSTHIESNAPLVVTNLTLCSFGEPEPEPYTYVADGSVPVSNTIKEPPIAAQPPSMPWSISQHFRRIAWAIEEISIRAKLT